MTPTYWVEMTLQVSGEHSVDRNVVEKFTSLLAERHDGELVYTFAFRTQQLSLAMSVTCDEPIEQVPPMIVGFVRSVAHDLGFHTPGWPEPVEVDDVRIRALAADSAVC